MSATTPSAPPRRARATIRDVAALAGVGIKTVSRVINNEANVSPQMRERVQRAITTLNFKPHQGAGALRRGDRKTLTLGLLLDAVDNPFSASINRAVESVASTRHTAVFAASFDDDPDRERELVDAFTRRRVDGLILTTITAEHGYLQSEREQGMPIVFVDRPPVGLAVDAVLSNNRAAAYDATRHLLASGHRAIAHLGDELAISTARERRHGFTDAMEEAGLTEPRSGWHIDDLRSAEEAYAAVHRLLDQASPPTALFTSQNVITIGAVRALHHLGRQHEVALIGFDDLILADALDPGVTVMAQDPNRMGTLAAERLFARLDGDRSSAETYVVPGRLIVRGSGEIPPPG
jgi:LacI family transcriptional regulator